jgi:two-component system NtrC family sensor kinase
MVTPIYNEPSCSDADCHAHPRSMKVLGVLDLSLDLAAVDEEAGAVRLRVFAISGGTVVVLAIFVAFFTRKFVEVPVRTLVERTHAMSITQLDTPVEINSSEEFSELAQSFDAMRVRLKVALEEINQFTQALETKVEERTEQLKAANQRLLQTDRLASLGQLAASVAHEINNPLSGVLNLSMLLQRIIRDDEIPPERRKEVRKYLSQITDETARVGRIVQDLLAFSRRSKPMRSSVNLNTLIGTTMNILDHKLRLMNVCIDRQLVDSLPSINCDGSQIQQVIFNLVMNAAEACQHKEGAKICVSTGFGSSGKDVLFAVADNGEGILPQIRDKIYEPFFTTKGVGKGVGLGLAVVYGIVEAHKGTIDLKTRVGEGTVFTVSLPRETEPTQISSEQSPGQVER